MSTLELVAKSRNFLNFTNTQDDVLPKIICFFDDNDTKNKYLLLDQGEMLFYENETLVKSVLAKTLSNGLTIQKFDGNSISEVNLQNFLKIKSSSGDKKKKRRGGYGSGTNHDDDYVFDDDDDIPVTSTNNNNNNNNNNNG